MAGGGTPRQKMINMMYLVLTALLALNVTKEILNAFVVVNVGLLQQKANLESKNAGTLTEFDTQVMTNPKNPKIKDFRDKAFEVNRLSNELVDYIEDLKVKFIVLNEGLKSEDEAKKMAIDPFLIQNKDNYDISTHFFGTGEGDGDKGTANELKNKLNAFKTSLTALVAEKHRADVEKRLHQLINTEAPEQTPEQIKNDGKKTWETFYFFHLPASAALVELTKWENIVRGTESEMLTHFWDQISATAFKFDAVEAKIIPKSTFVTSGSNFEAEVFLAAYSTSVKPEIVYGTKVDSIKGEVENGVSLDTASYKDGKGIISLPVTGAGERVFAGVIKVNNPVTGEITPYPFATAYNVAPPSATVSPTMMNVVYAGLDNPIEVSVPGVAPNNVIVSGPGLTGSNGKYNVKPNSSSREMTITVSAKQPDGKVMSMGAFKFRIKRVPTPVVTWAGVREGRISVAAASNSPIIPVVDGFDFPVYPSIISFDFTINVKGNLTTKSCKGNRIPSDLSAQLRSLPVGTKMYIENVRANVPGDAQPRTLPAASFTLQK